MVDAHRVLHHAVEAAIQAPSSHNTQPWRFRIANGRLEVRADLGRHLTVIDPERRQLYTSCGCAIYNARVAVRVLGWNGDVAVLPDPCDPSLLATIELGERIITSDGEHALMHAIPLRHTNRRPFLDRPVAAEISDQLAVAAALNGAWLVRLGPEGKRTLGELIEEADRMRVDDPAFRRELAAWLIPFAERRRDGIPFSEMEYGSRMPFTMRRALHSPHLGDRLEVEHRLFEHAPLAIVIGTAGDELTDWVAAGQALEAVLLHATHYGLSAAFENQVVEVPRLRGALAAIAGHRGAPQTVLRLGYPEAPVHRTTPRRRLEDVLAD